MIPSQMLKGVLEGSVHAIISRQETYGYEISQELERYGFGKITEGTIYPLLLRLEKNGALEAVYRASDVGPKRKYYHLTEKGRAELAQFVESFGELATAVQGLLDDKGGVQNATGKCTEGQSAFDGKSECDDGDRGLHSLGKYQRA